MDVSFNKLVFDAKRKPNLAMMLKAPARANKEPRNLWLLLDTGVSMDGLHDEGNPIAFVTGVIAEAKLPEQYQRLPTRPLLNIGVGAYNDIRDQYHDYLGIPRPSTERAKRTPKRVMQERRAAQGGPVVKVPAKTNQPVQVKKGVTALSGRAAVLDSGVAVAKPRRKAKS